MTKFITTRQREILNVLKEFLQQNNQAPTLGELERIFGITRRAVVKHLDALEKKGLIMRSSQARGIRLVEDLQSGQFFLNVPILGFANAGQPMVIAEEIELGQLRIKKQLLPVSEDVFALQIKGDSMNNRKVNGKLLSDGNYALIAKNQIIKDGDVVLAIIDNCATIKSVKHDAQILILYPESTNNIHRPFYLDAGEDEQVIYGKVIGVLENPSFN